MGSEALLQRACEVAFAIAREDAEADPAVEPPGDMRSFLYLARLPRRAIAVAQQAIEDDDDFRAKVASRASEEEVGRAGYLWLHRPIGWASEFEELSETADGSDGDDGDDEPEADHEGEDQPETDESDGADAESVSLLGLDDFDATNGSDFEGLDEMPGISLAAAPEIDPEADAIESELTSLRGLVDRLAGERELVMSGSNNEPIDGSDPNRLQDEVAAVSSELTYARDELSRTTDDLNVARNEREEARRQHSAALKRQVEVERELATIREERATIESNSSDLQVQLISVEDRLKRIEGELEEAGRERDVAHSQLETMTNERNQVREERVAMKAERDALQTRLAEVDEKTGGVDVGELTAANRSLTQELEATSRELSRMISQVETYEDQLQTSTAASDALQTEKAELTSRIADAELALETTKTQYSALKDDAERLAAEVGTLRAERDGLQSQLTELQASLTDVLDEHAEIRHRNDADRKSLNELRVERDVLLARMNDIEQADRSHENRINALVKERDDLMMARDELMVERGELRGEMASVASARDQVTEKLDGLETKLGPLELELQAERRQREELATRLLELDDIAAANRAIIDELTTERDQLVDERGEVGKRLESLEAERIDITQLTAARDELAGQLERAEAQRNEEAERRLTSVAELTEQVGALESARTALETQISETQGELSRVRSDIDELNRENAKLRFNLQVAESSVAETTDAADEARKSAAEATARAAAAEARADRAEVAAADFAVAPLAGQVELDAGPEPDTAERDEDEFAAEAEDLPAVDDEVVSEPVPTEADEEAEAEIEPEAEAAAEVDESIQDVDEDADVEPADIEVDDGEPAMAGEPAEVAPELELPDEIEDVEADFEYVDEDKTAELDEVVVADPDAVPPFSPADEVVEMDQHRDRDETSPFVNDWKPVGSVDDEHDELDEISELISQTVSGFEVPLDDVAPEPPGFGETTNVIGDLAAPPSVFTGAESPLDEPASPFEEGLADVTGGDFASSSRRQIEIPAEIAEDEIAVAQHVVSSPDVVLLVDGDSVAKLGWPTLPVPQQRDALVTYLADLSVSSGAAPDVVFDGRIGDDEQLPVSRAVRIRLSTPPTEPAAALDELVSAYPDQWPIALVTDDSSLAASAQDRGAVVLNNGQLLDLFIAQ